MFYLTISSQTKIDLFGWSCTSVFFFGTEVVGNGDTLNTLDKVLI